MIWSFWQALLQDEGWQQCCDQSSQFPLPTDSPSTQRTPGQRSPWQTVDFCPSSVSGWLVLRPNRGSLSFANFWMPEERKALWMACLSVKQWAVNPENFQRLRNSVRKHEIRFNGKFATWTVKCGPQGFVKSTILNFNLTKAFTFTIFITCITNIFIDRESWHLRMGRTDESTAEATVINIKGRNLNTKYYDLQRHLYMPSHIQAC